MKNILILQTGGTISMQFEKDGIQLDTAKWSDVLYKQLPELNQIADIEIKNVFFEDSSDIHPHHWNLLSETVFQYLPHFDGFVILHGTDTMAYTASALSFSLKNLNKPVIFTGSQMPMSTIRSDAKRNLINAVELATYPIHEVAISFNDHLFRGNRSTKMSIGDFDAFASPNFPSLAEIGINIQLSGHIIVNDEKEPELETGFDESVHVIKIHPAMQVSILESLDLSSIKALIIEAYGIGNVPIKESYSILNFVEQCRKQNCEVIITSQAAYDAVDLSKYEGGRALQKLGCISAGDMTMETAITKAMHLLEKGIVDNRFNSFFTSNIAGEINGPSQKN